MSSDTAYAMILSMIASQEDVVIEGVWQEDDCGNGRVSQLVARIPGREVAVKVLLRQDMAGVKAVAPLAMALRAAGVQRTATVCSYDAIVGIAEMVRQDGFDAFLELVVEHQRQAPYDFESMRKAFADKAKEHFETKNLAETFPKAARLTSSVGQVIKAFEQLEKAD